MDHRGFKEPDRALLIKSWDQRRQLIKSLGIDPRENKIEIVIGSHFGMGGIRVNRNTETTLPGLYAAEEVMGGVHGGMRLSGYSFTQMIVFGFEAGRRAGRYALENPPPKELSGPEIEREKRKMFGFLEKKNDPHPLNPLIDLFFNLQFEIYYLQQFLYEEKKEI